ncbi:unnamed protein product [Strongylus vulgaris]|uniref:DUF7505 domain-containing protein n=1 Tax=Strongylus vulgaris TaxID=40348 RepID=A0A3P7JFQ4_STRVU|nr:unnamed protein product [Strongylus vulgaris]
MVLALLLLLLVTTVDGQYSQGHFCIPHPTNIHWVPYSKPPCLHPGQPIFEWPGGSNCSQHLSLHSEQISVDETGLVFAKQRLCFYFTVELIEYTYKWKDVVHTGQFKIGHPKFTKQKRFKRWLRRRNPDPNAIHFQQER